MAGKIQFGDWVWDPNTLELRNGSRITTLEPRVAKLFEFLIANPDEILSHDRLVEAVWDGRTVSDEAVRRAVFSLRRAFDVGDTDSYIRTIHKKGYIASFPEPVAAGDEVTASGTIPTPLPESAEPDVAPAPAMPPETAPAATAVLSPLPKLLKIIGVVALVVAALTRIDWWEHDAPFGKSSNSADVATTIAVLPLVNLSEGTDNEFLSDGLSEELLGTLARNRGLRVTARSSAFQFKGQNHDIRDVGERLGVRYVLEGTVRSLGERVRINVRLVDAESGTQLWAETYDRTMVNWFDLQQDVAVEVARALNVMLQHGEVTTPPPGVTNNVEAHLEVLRARQLLATHSVADAEQAIEHLQRALTLDSRYAVAYAWLADAILIKAESTTGIEGARSTVAPLLDKALELDPGLGEAYALRSMLTDDADIAEADLRRGLELNPSYARGYELLTQLQMASPKFSESMQGGDSRQLEMATESIDRAIALDPLSPNNFHTKAGLMMRMGYWPEAAEANRHALELNPQFRGALMALGTILAIEGNFAEAIDYTERAVALDPRAVLLRSQLVLLYLTVGDFDGARLVITPVDIRQPDTDNAPTVSPASAAGDKLLLLWSAGDIEHAADMIYSGVVTHSVATPQILLTQALVDKNFARALALLLPTLPFTESLPPQASGWGLYAYANLAQLLLLSGDESAAARLEMLIEERMKVLESRFPRYAILNDQVRAVLLARAGRNEDACAALERAYTPAPRLYWRMIESNPAFDGMRSTPCFQTLATRLNAHLVAERVRVDEMRRTGQIPDRVKGNTKTTTGAAL
ncbi:MAG: winged helix-turn-helix domain-containing protein [Halioglobus sp.]|nr:winged helix-turn-helix domain-containing protein [Halioglobus sp.]